MIYIYIIIIILCTNSPCLNHKLTKPPLILHEVLQLPGQNLEDMQMTPSSGDPLSLESRPQGHVTGLG